MPDPIFSADFVNNEYVSPPVSESELFMLATGVQNPNVDLTPLGMRCFEKRSNTLWPSNDFTHPRWGRARAVPTPNAALAPNGTMTATMLSDAAGSGYHGVYNLCSVTPSRLHVLPIHVKAGTSSKGRIWYCRGSAGGWTDFDLVTKAVTKYGSAFACYPIELDDGWFLIVLISTCGSETSAYFQIDVNNAAGANSYAGTGTNSLYIWEAGIQCGDTLGPFLPTTTGIVTHQANDYVRVIPEVSAMTKVIKARTPKLLPVPAASYGTDAQVLWHVDNLSEANDLEAWRAPNGHIIAEMHQNNVSTAKIDLGFRANDTDFKIAISTSAATGLMASIDGEPALYVPTGPWPTGMISEKLGTNAWMMNPPAGYIPRYWNSTIASEETYSVALSASELEILSAL